MNKLMNKIYRYGGFTGSKSECDQVRQIVKEHGAKDLGHCRRAQNFIKATIPSYMRMFATDYVVFKAADNNQVTEIFNKAKETMSFNTVG
jgi:hypothetical protein